MGYFWANLGAEKGCYKGYYDVQRGFYTDFEYYRASMIRIGLKAHII